MIKISPTEPTVALFTANTYQEIEQDDEDEEFNLSHDKNSISVSEKNVPYRISINSFWEDRI